MRNNSSNSSNTARCTISSTTSTSRQKAMNLRELNIDQNDTDFEDDEVASKASSSDEESSESCVEFDTRARVQAHKRENGIAFRGCVSTGDKQSFDQLRLEMAYMCGGTAGTSVPALAMKRETGCPWKGRRNASQAMAQSYSNNITCSFMPNSRKIVDKLRTKSFCCQYIDNGSQLVVASQDEKIRFYEARGSRDKYLRKKEVHVQCTGWSILDVALNKEGTCMAYGTWKDTVFIGRFTDENTEGITWHDIDIANVDYSMALFSLRFSKCGNELLCGSSDHALRVFDLTTMTNLITIEDAHEDDVNAVCYGDNASHLIYSGGDDGVVKVWDRRAWSEHDHHPVGVFAGHQDGITYIDSRGDDRYLLSNCKDQSIKIWDLRKFSSHEAIANTRKSIVCQKWDYRWQPAPDFRRDAVSGDTSVATMRGHSVLHTLVRAKFSPSRTGRRYVYTGCARGEVVVYDLLTGEVSNRLAGHQGVVRDVAWHPEGNEITSCSWDGSTAVWRFDSRYLDTGSKDELSCDEMYESLGRRRAHKQTHKNSKRARVVVDSDSD